MNRFLTVYEFNKTAVFSFSTVIQNIQKRWLIYNTKSLSEHLNENHHLCSRICLKRLYHCSNNCRRHCMLQIQNETVMKKHTWPYVVPVLSIIIVCAYVGEVSFPKTKWTLLHNPEIVTKEISENRTVSV